MKRNNKLDNLEFLCFKCHRKRSHGRLSRLWKSYVKSNKLESSEIHAL